ncbi:hypothetical protein SAMN05421788_101211 [Filimonas lacunae]|uniref:Serine aminopeptidase S33 domain-containing protein n=1 Tax=Filimonas lacunae TaxID=477680 RepID=A0A173MM83_9BACT|nr:alpha/beta fold hydrolase [Filimonas lacunae]BAV08755.1 alpha/beta hydrolase fold [Filimonas lacunae]SIS61188.1 hypothetical protein SAMN05421788_101211 [Filimonas lacunae]
MKPTSRLKKSFLWMVVLLILFLNFVAFFHAWKFTHFTPGLPYKTSSRQQLSLTGKLKLGLLGVDNPRPVTKRLPGVPYQDITLQSNKRIACWLITAPNAKGTIVLFHGYTGEKSSMLDKADVFLKAGYTVLLPDFMGSGSSEGNQTTIGYKEAAEVKTCVDYLQQKGEKHIYLFGTSMGAAAIMKAFKDQPLSVSGVILECPFSTMLTTVQNRFENMHIPAFPMSYLLVFWGGVENGFNAFAHKPVNDARAITCPTLLVYGEKDEKVKPEETQAIFKNLAGPKKLVTFPLAAHDNYLVQYKKEWSEAVTSFLGQLP